MLLVDPERVLVILTSTKGMNGVWHCYVPRLLWIISERADPCPRIRSSSRDFRSVGRPPRCWMLRLICRLPWYSKHEALMKSSSKSRCSLAGASSDHQLFSEDSSTWRRIHRKHMSKWRVVSALTLPLAWSIASRIHLIVIKLYKWIILMLFKWRPTRPTFQMTSIIQIKKIGQVDCNQVLI